VSDEGVSDEGVLVPSVPELVPSVITAVPAGVFSPSPDSAAARIEPMPKELSTATSSSKANIFLSFIVLLKEIIPFLFRFWGC
jgi:hypothetical protein